MTSAMRISIGLIFAASLAMEMGCKRPTDRDSDPAPRPRSPSEAPEHDRPSASEEARGPSGARGSDRRHTVRTREETSRNDDEPRLRHPELLECFQTGYPEAVGASPEITFERGIAWIEIEGTRLEWNDRESKSVRERFFDPDLQDTLSEPYPLDDFEPPPTPGRDPGRYRSDSFMKTLYGRNAREVQENLTSVEWVDGTSIAFQKRHGAAEDLREVVEELRQLPPSQRRYLDDPSGTFNWRNIQGIDKLSNHAFAIAIDLNVEHANYWRWDLDPWHPSEEYRNRFPTSIVEIFESHGFIWGGKWYHYDTMHFEYRPGLIACARAR